MHVLWRVSLVGLSGLGGLAKQHGDEMEMQLSKKLHLGDRVIVQLKRTSEHIRATGAFLVNVTSHDIGSCDVA